MCCNCTTFELNCGIKCIIFCQSFDVWSVNNKIVQIKFCQLHFPIYFYFELLNCILIVSLKYFGAYKCAL